MANAIQSYQDLQVWQKSMDLAEGAYRLAATFPRDEMYGMTSQLRRSAASIPANIAEGYGRELTGSFVQYLRMAQGSLKETETHLLLAKRVALQLTQPLNLYSPSAMSWGGCCEHLFRTLETKV